MSVSSFVPVPVLSEEMIQTKLPREIQKYIYYKFLELPIIVQEIIKSSNNENNYITYMHSLLHNPRIVDKFCKYGMSICEEVCSYSTDPYKILRYSTYQFAILYDLIMVKNDETYFPLIKSKSEKFVTTFYFTMFH